MPADGKTTYSPDRSRYATLFESLGHAVNAPVMVALYQLVQRAGPTVGYSLIAVIIGVVGLGLGALGMVFAKFKDRMYEELGLIKYTILMVLLLMMMGVLGKIMLRLLFGVKYLISIPTFSLNI
jgi:hypothetical protein